MSNLELRKRFVITDPDVEVWPVTSRQEWLARRRQDITASAAAALWGDGAHPYTSAFELYCIKGGVVEEEQEETPAMRRGRLLEPIALQMLREERPGWKITAGAEYFRDAKARIGATPDAYALRPDVEGRGAIQIKTAGQFAFKKGWLDSNDQLKVPLWIAVQASVEAFLTGSTWAVVVVLVLGDGGLDLHIIDIPLIHRLMVKLRKLTDEFWRRVAAEDPYPPNYATDGWLIDKIYPDDDGSIVQWGNDERAISLLDERARLKAIEAQAPPAKKRRDQIDDELRMKLGNASAATLADGRVISASVVKRKAYSVQEGQSRPVKVDERLYRGNQASAEAVARSASDIQPKPANDRRAGPAPSRHRGKQPAKDDGGITF